MECPICRTRMEDDMFSPLTHNITDLLAVPCIFMDQGCTIKLKKSKIVKHEKEEYYLHLIKTFKHLNFSVQDAK